MQSRLFFRAVQSDRADRAAEVESVHRLKKEHPAVRVEVGHACESLRRSSADIRHATSRKAAVSLPRRSHNFALFHIHTG